jgi:hypothetical protein
MAVPILHHRGNQTKHKKKQQVVGHINDSYGLPMINLEAFQTPVEARRGTCPL